MFNSPFSFHDDECIEKEALIKPIPIMIMKGGSVHDLTKSKNSGKNRKLSKDTTKKYQTTDFDDIVAEIKQNNNYRPPKPN